MANNSKPHPARDIALVMTRTLRLLYLFLSAGVFLLDRLTKVVIENSLALQESRTVIPGFFHLVHVRNQGIAFGLFADSPSATRTSVLVFFSAVALAGVVLLFWTADPAAERMSAGLSLILGGALGNLFDRVQRGGVVDFLDFFVSSYHWPAFNLADSAIVVGGGLLLLHMLHREKQ